MGMDTLGEKTKNQEQVIKPVGYCLYARKSTEEEDRQAHKPIITKELFDKIQASIQDHYISKTESKEFAFTRLITCGYFQSGITADEKFRRLKNGGVNRHVYYRCTRARDTDCSNKPINETLLIEKLANLLDRINLDKLGMKTKIEDEIKRYNRFRMGVLGKKTKDRTTDINVRNYAKYLLKDGIITEKRELLSCLKSKLILKDREISID